MDIIKRSGIRQKFSIKKLEKSIVMAGRRAKLSVAKVREVTKRVSGSVLKSLRGKSSIRATNLRRMVLTRFNRSAKAAAASWRRYDRTKKSR